MSCAEVHLPGRIVLIDPSSFTIPYDTALLQALANEGVHVRLLGPAGETCDNPLRHGHFYPVLASPLGRSLPRAGQRLVKGMSHPVDMLRLANWLAAFGTEIVHFQWAPVPLIDRWLIALLGRRLPVVLTLHDSNPYQGHASWLMRRGYTNLLMIFDSIIVHTEQARRRVIAMGVDPGTVHCIPHGLLGHEGSICAPSKRPGPGSRLVLLQFGKIKPYKGVDILLAALALLSAEIRRQLDVRIVGKPYMETASIDKLISDHGLADCVTTRFKFVSNTEAEHLFGEAAAILLPYREIDASGVAMSAIARGLPVLATAIDGFRELFDGGGGARLVPAEDPRALAAAIAEWVADPQQLKTLAASMADRRSCIPGWDEIAALHLDAYNAAHAHWLAHQSRARLV
jgi:glycosyltransferase involved in cell wall biosynthesis